MPTTVVNGVKHHYMEIGKGLPVLLIHGFPLSGEVWMEVAGLLSAKYRVIVPDLRGFGLSENHGPFTIEDLAEDMHQLLQSIHATPCVVGGLSMGGYVALALAKSHPTDLMGLMLVDTRADADTPAAKTNRHRLIELVKQDGPAAVARQMLQKVVSDHTKQLQPDVVGDLKRIMEQCPAATIEFASLAMCDRADQTAFLPSVTVPALVIAGQQDIPSPPDVAHNMAHDMPHARAVIIPNAGHMTPIESPADVANAMSDFLAHVHAI